MKLTKKQIEKIIKNTPEYLKGHSMRLDETLGTFTPCGANWSYYAGWVHIDKRPVLVVTRFGEIM